MTELERRRIIKSRRSFAYRFGDRFTRMTGIDAPEARTGVEQRALTLVVEIHAFGPREHPRRSFWMALYFSSLTRSGEMANSLAMSATL